MNLVQDVTYSITMNMDICIRFVVLESVISGTRLVFMGRREYVKYKQILLQDIATLWF